MKRFWIVILIAGVAIIAMSAIQYFSRPSQGDAAPQFELQDIQGKRVTLAEFKGLPVLVHFWATWCGQCLREMPSLDKLYEDLGDDGLVVLGIAEDDLADRGKVKRFAEMSGIGFPILMDSDGKVADEYMSYGVPDTIFVDGEGVIRWRGAGAIDWSSRGAREEIRNLMKITGEKTHD